MSYDCPHGDDPRSCPPCQSKNLGKRLPPRLSSSTARDGVTIDARFKSQCPRCRELIDIDDRITMTQDGWVCEECA